MNAGRTHRALAASALLFALLLSAGCGHPQNVDPPQAPVAVQVQEIRTAAEGASITASGSLQSAREATVSSKVMGQITEIRRHAGDPVRQGETLLTIDSRDVAGQIAQAEGALAQARAAAVLAETNLHRFEQLAKRGSASQLELDQARYQSDTAKGAVEQAEGALATAQSYQAYAAIPSPFSGRVVDQLCETGDLAAPGRPLMKVEDPSHLRLFASLDASKAAAAVVGSVVPVRVPSIEGRSFSGKVAEVVPAADPATRTVLVKIDLEPDSSLRPGLFAEAELPSGSREALRVPRSAVVQRGGISGVFVADQGRAAFRLVLLADDPSDEPEVLSGLQAGDRVVVNPPADLEVDARIEVRS